MLNWWILLFCDYHQYDNCWTESFRKDDISIQLIPYCAIDLPYFYYTCRNTRHRNKNHWESEILEIHNSFHFDTSQLKYQQVSWEFMLNILLLSFSINLSTLRCNTVSFSTFLDSFQCFAIFCLIWEYIIVDSLRKRNIGEKF